MFEETRKVLDNFEKSLSVVNNPTKFHKEDEDVILYFEIDLAKALIKEAMNSDKIAKIILAHKGMIGDLKAEIK